MGKVLRWTATVIAVLFVMVGVIQVANGRFGAAAFGALIAWALWTKVAKRPIPFTT